MFLPQRLRIFSCLRRKSIGWRFLCKEKQCTISREINNDCFLKNNNKAQIYPPRATFKVQHCHFQRSKQQWALPIDTRFQPSYAQTHTSTHPRLCCREKGLQRKRTAVRIAYPPSGKGDGKASSEEEKQITSCCLACLRNLKGKKKKKAAVTTAENQGK